MLIEITNKQTIELTPENKLEADIFAADNWRIEQIQPESFDLFRIKLRLTCGEVDDGGVK